MSSRKIIHIDMDAFYASVELREQPHLKGRPVVVAWEGARSVICAASYEARQFGLHSAMSVATAKRLCPQAVYVPPHFDLYRQVSAQIHAVFRRYTDLIEPLSLDEAYLDVTRNFKNIPYASEVAKEIRAAIFAETGLTASAGIAPNKFLAKIASDWRKPNGQFVLPPHKVMAFLETLPLGKIRLYDLARGTDERPVKAERERLQISTEITLPEDLPLEHAAGHLHHLAEDLWRQITRKNVEAQSVTLKLKTYDFRIITRTLTYSSALPDCAALLQAAQMLMARVPPQTEDAFRLIGIGVGRLVPKNQQQGLWA